jgi:hypothetical protein
MAFRHRASFVFVSALAGLLLLGGCSKKLVVAQVPSFWTRDLKVIAVIPFENLTGTQGAGRAVSDQLAATLVQNGTYKVYDRAQVQSLMTERDWQIAQGDPNAAAAKLQGKAQALLVGSVSTYAGTRAQPEWRVTPVNYTDANGNPYTRNVRWLYEHNEGTVAVAAQLIRVPGGEPIYGTGQVFGRAVSESTPPPSYTKPQMDAHTCLASARQQAVHQLTEHFAVVTKEIKVDKDSLKTARRNAVGRWEKQDKFAPGQPIAIVLKLPPSADRNIFRIVVLDEDEQQSFYDQEVTFGRDHCMTGQAIEVPAGQMPPGKYKVKLFSRFQEEAALETKFEIDPDHSGKDD